MKKPRLVSAVVLGLLGLNASSALADYAVEFVGINPFPDFPNTGGTGDHIGNIVEKTFTSLGDVPIIIHFESSSQITNGFDVIDTPGAVETMHIDERVRNDTGVDWTAFHFVVHPIDANPALNVEFLNVVDNTNNWNSSNTGKGFFKEGFLSLFGSVPNGDIFSLSFDLQINSPPGAFNLFGITEFPSRLVPSPGASTLALIGCSLVGLIKRRSGVRASA